jgi:hypothetical protein
MTVYLSLCYWVCVGCFGGDCLDVRVRLLVAEIICGL